MKKYTDTTQKSYAAGRRKRERRKNVRVVATKMKLKKGDMVVVVSGKDKGKQGAILKVMPKLNRLIVDGINKAKRHSRKVRGQTGRIVEILLPINASNVMLLDPSEKKGTRVARRAEGGKNVRYAKKGGSTLK